MWYISITTLTTTLPGNLVDDLRDYASSMKQSKNKFIPKALYFYFEHLKRNYYVHSFKMVKEDQDLFLMEEEGMETYMKEIELSAGE